MFLRLLAALLFVSISSNSYSSFVESYDTIVIGGAPSMVKPEDGNVWGRIDFECPNYRSFIGNGEALRNGSRFRLQMGALNELPPENCFVKVSYYLKRSIKDICKNSSPKGYYIYCEFNFKGLEVLGKTSS
uniref:Phytocyanin domain-containing protein n=1 Tax=Strongyloides papillosus TaxID=174720 RepID=A0A0N5BJA8_STREA